MADLPGLEPGTHRLTADCSTIELQTNVGAEVLLTPPFLFQMFHPLFPDFLVLPGTVGMPWNVLP